MNHCTSILIYSDGSRDEKSIRGELSYFGNIVVFQKRISYKSRFNCARCAVSLKGFSKKIHRLKL